MKRKCAALNSTLSRGLRIRRRAKTGREWRRQGGGVEDYLQQLYRIYNRTFAALNREFTSEDSALMFNIAYMDPLEGTGDAPLMAQGMLGLVGGHQEDRVFEFESGNQTRSKVFPNPVSDLLYVTLTYFHVGDCKMQVYDITGTLQKSWQLFSYRNSIDISDLHNGLYLFDITLDGKSIDHGKFVKQ